MALDSVPAAFVQERCVGFKSSLKRHVVDDVFDSFRLGLSALG